MKTMNNRKQVEPCDEKEPKLSCKTTFIGGTGYCSVIDQNVTRKSVFNDHLKVKRSLSYLSFEKCKIVELPLSTNVLNHVPFLDTLRIYSSELIKITKDDLKGYDCLKRLTIHRSNIKELPGDLFQHIPHLEQIDLRHNSIKFIGRNIVEPLKDLEWFDLRDNPGVNIRYEVKDPDSITLREFNEIIKKCQRTETAPEQNREVKELKVRNSRLEEKVKELEKKFSSIEHKQKQHKKEIDDMKVSNKRFGDEFKQEVEVLKTKNMRLEEELKDIKGKFPGAVEGKNFTIRFNGKEYKVNRAVFAAESKKIARLVDETPDTYQVEVQEIAENVIEAIVDYLNFTEDFAKNVNLTELYETSLELEMDNLAGQVYNLMVEKVNPETALNVLLLCNKCEGSDELKMKAFDEFKKNFPTLVIPLDFASNPEKLQQLMKTKIEMESLIASG